MPDTHEWILPWDSGMSNPGTPDCFCGICNQEFRQREKELKADDTASVLFEKQRHQNLIAEQFLAQSLR